MIPGAGPFLIAASDAMRFAGWLIKQGNWPVAEAFVTNWNAGEHEWWKEAFEKWREEYGKTRS
jgi:hypothetical protein